MSLDIKEGDLLVVSSVEYPVRSVANWAQSGFNTAGFQSMASLSASTKRAPAISGGKRDVPADNLSGLSCTPLDPVDPELRATLNLDTQHELLQTFLSDGDGFVHLILEQLKR